MISPTAPSLQGRRIFILEDEGLVSMMVEAMVEELGGIVQGTHGQISTALAFIEANHGEIDAAILDLNLGGMRSYDVAQALTGRGIPFIFSTGYDDDSIDAQWRNHPRIGKPFQLGELSAALQQAMQPALPDTTRD